jgi:RNA polymerase sigma factor (sigma-70 family)
MDGSSLSATWSSHDPLCHTHRMPGSGDGARGQEVSVHAEAPPLARVVAAAVAVDEDAVLRGWIAEGHLRRTVARLMERHGDAVFSFALRVVGDEEAARDVLQQVFLEAHRDLSSFAGRSSFKTWLLSIANHRALDAVRARRRRSKRLVDEDELVERSDDDAPCAVALLDGSRETSALEHCLAQLAPEVRAALLMRFSQELRYDEIAQLTGDRVGTLHARVTRAMPVLRRCLESKGIAP